MKDKNFVFLSALLIFSTYLFCQINYFVYYSKTGSVFGKSDVDNYMRNINEGKIRIDHIMIDVIGILTKNFISPELLYSFIIPFEFCFFLFTIYIFSFYFLRSHLICFYALLIFLVGTFAIDVFLITALWAQMIATSIALFLIVFVDLFFKGNIKDNSVKLYFIILIIICVLSHPVSIGMVVIFFLAKLLNSGVLSKNTLFVILILSVLIAGVVLYFGTSLTGKYRNEVDLKYMLDNYMLVYILVFALYFMYMNTNNIDLRSLIMTNLFITIISPGFVLWRPILSLLPIYSLFAAAGLYKFLKSALSVNKFMTYLVIASLIGMTIIYKIEVTNSFMQALLWETETPPGIEPDLPRHIDPKAIRELYFGQKFQYNDTIEKYN